jgi:hypothetical protein
MVYLKEAHFAEGDAEVVMILGIFFGGRGVVGESGTEFVEHVVEVGASCCCCRSENWSNYRCCFWRSSWRRDFWCGWDDGGRWLRESGLRGGSTVTSALRRCCCGKR